MKTLPKTPVWAWAIVGLLCALTHPGSTEGYPGSRTSDRRDSVGLARREPGGPAPGPAISVPDAKSWEAAFAFVRDSIRTEASSFSLKTVEGVRWGRSGNSLEKSLLLARLLQDGKETVRIAEGNLDEAAAKALLGTAFPATKTFSYAPDVPVFAPAEDADLLSAAKRHFWVRLKEGDKWVDLDPSFPAADPGRSFASAIRTYDPSDEILGTRVYISLEVTSDRAARPDRVLTWEGRMEKVAHQPLSLSIVAGFQTSAQGEEKQAQTAGGAFGALGGLASKPQRSQAPEKTLYNGVLTVSGEKVADARFSDEKGVINQIALRFQFKSLGKVVSESERLLFERTGKESVPPLFERHGILITGNRIPPEAWQDGLKAVSKGALLGDVKAGVEEVKKNINSKKFDRNTLEKSAELEETLGPELGHLLNMIFASISDGLTEQLGEALSVHSYYGAPRILIASFVGDKERAEATIDLRQDRIEAVPYPGQAEAIKGTFLYGRGVMESVLEGRLLGLFSGKPALTTAVLMQEAARKNIPIRMFSALDRESLRKVRLPPEAAKKVDRALESGRIVALPETSVSWEGENRWGWWDIDPQTMETIGVMDTGLHQAVVERTILETRGPLQTKMGFVIGAIVGAVDTQWMIAGMILKHGEVNKAALLEAKAYMKGIQAYMCPGFEKKVSVGAEYTVAEMEDCYKIGLEFKVKAGVEIKQGWCENFAKGFACASATILNNYLNQYK